MGIDNLGTIVAILSSIVGCAWVLATKLGEITTELKGLRLELKEFKDQKLAERLAVVERIVFQGEAE